MKKALTLLITLAVFAGCSVTSEKYKYQQRFDRFYNILNSAEKKDFAENSIDKVGASLDKRVAEDKKLAASWLAVQTEEAINTFDGVQSVRFFREIILRELNRNPFYRFMDLLDQKAQADFAFNNDFPKSLNQALGNRNLARLMDSVRTEYRLYGFSNDQIADFFRKVSFAEVSRKELYPVLKMLKNSMALADFRGGNISAASQKLEQALSKNISAKYDLDAIRKRSGLTKVDVKTFLDINYNVIMKEMDPGAVERTLGKF